MMASEIATPRVKGERGGVLSAQIYNLIVAYKKFGILPSLKTLRDADLVDNYYTKHGSGRGRFRTWAKRMYFRPSDQQLIHKNTGKIIIPLEQWESTILHIHCGGSVRNDNHLSIQATLRKIQKKYTVGKRSFGMSENYVKDVVRSCTSGSCLIKKLADWSQSASEEEFSMKPLLEVNSNTQTELEKDDIECYSCESEEEDQQTEYDCLKQEAMMDTQESFCSPTASFTKTSHTSSFGNHFATLAYQQTADIPSNMKQQSNVETTLDTVSTISQKFPVLMSSLNNMENDEDHQKDGLSNLNQLLQIANTFEIPNLVSAAVSRPFQVQNLVPVTAINQPLMSAVPQKVIVPLVNPALQAPPFFSFGNSTPPQPIQVGSIKSIASDVDTNQDTSVTSSGKTVTICVYPLPSNVSFPGVSKEPFSTSAQSKDQHMAIKTVSSQNMNQHMAIKTVSSQNMNQGIAIKTIPSQNTNQGMAIKTISSQSVNQCMGIKTIPSQSMNKGMAIKPIPVISSTSSITTSEWDAASPEKSVNLQEVMDASPENKPWKKQLKNKISARLKLKSPSKESRKERREEKGKKKLIELKKEQKAKVKDLLLKSISSIKKTDPGKQKTTQLVKNPKCSTLSIQDHINTVIDTTMNIENSMTTRSPISTTATSSKMVYDAPISDALMVSDMEKIMVQPLGQCQSSNVNSVEETFTSPLTFDQANPLFEAASMPLPCVEEPLDPLPEGIKHNLLSTPIKKKFPVYNDRRACLKPCPDTPPYKNIWHHFEDVKNEKNCYTRIVHIIRDMRIDVMKSVMKDRPAAERLKKKIAYGESLLHQHRAFLNQH